MPPDPEMLTSRGGRRLSLRALRLDELDLVAVGVFDEGDDRSAALDRAGFACDLAAAAANCIAGLGDVGNADGDVAEGAAEVVALDPVVVGELEHGGAVLGVVADEGERVFLLRAVGGAQELHAEDFGVELDRALQVAHAQHRMQDSHVAPWMMGIEAPASSSWCRARRQSG